MLGGAPRLPYTRAWFLTRYIITYTMPIHQNIELGYFKTLVWQLFLFLENALRCLHAPMLMVHI